MNIFTLVVFFFIASFGKSYLANWLYWVIWFVMKPYQTLPPVMNYIPTEQMLSWQLYLVFLNECPSGLSVKLTVKSVKFWYVIMWEAVVE